MYAFYRELHVNQQFCNIVNKLYWGAIIREQTNLQPALHFFDATDSQTKIYFSWDAFLRDTITNLQEDWDHVTSNQRVSPVCFFTLNDNEQKGLADSDPDINGALDGTFKSISFQ